MAETIVFSLPIPGAYEDPAYSILWYQSVDGQNWNQTPADTALISALPFANGKYTWASSVVNENLYHKIKSKTQLGIESASAIILPPRSSLTKPNGMSLNNLDGIQTYTLGDTIELIFKTDTVTADAIGSTIHVDIVDVFNNVIDTLTADRLGDIYIAEWNIPLNISSRYNVTKRDETGYDITLFFLKDVWKLGVGSKLEFNFQVLRKLESPTEDNNVIQLFVENIEGTDGSKLSKNMLAFTTLLAPYYTSVTSVKDLYRELLDGYDNFTVARSIINTSKIVDYHMKPKQIYREDAFNLARANFVKFKTAWNLLLSVIQVNSERKQLDNFSVERSTAGPKLVLDQLEDEARKFALFIWAGGKDTPFTSKTFEKGLFDINRPNIGRTLTDEGGWFPWVNHTSQSTIIMVGDDAVEARGERNIAYPYLRNRFTGSIDNGDAGYLSGV